MDQGSDSFSDLPTRLTGHFGAYGWSPTCPFPPICASRAGCGPRAWFRKLCHQRCALMNSRKSRQRLDPYGRRAKSTLRLQIAGGDAQMMAEAARHERTALWRQYSHRYSIWVGRRKKVLRTNAAGQPDRGRKNWLPEILDAVWSTPFSLPVTLKIVPVVAQSSATACKLPGIAEQAGIKPLRSPWPQPAISLLIRRTAQLQQHRRDQQAIGIARYLANGDYQIPAESPCCVKHLPARMPYMIAARQADLAIFQ